MINDNSWKVGKIGSGWYRLYDGMRAVVNWGLISYFKKEIGAKLQGNVLEAGSGPAYGTFQISKVSGIKLSTALDHDIEALKEARRRDPNLHAVVGDLYHLPFKPNSFSLVWNNSTLEHLDVPVDALAQMKQVVKSGGYVYVGVPFRFGPFFFQSFIKNTKFGKWIGPVFSHAEILQLFAQAALNPLQARIDRLRLFIGILAVKP